MLANERKVFLRDQLRRKFEDYTEEDVYCNGRVVFPFQINTTVNFEQPFSTLNEPDTYEETLAEYFCGREADIDTNNGGLVILRGATGSGKTTAIRRAISLAQNRLSEENPNATLETTVIDLNGITLSDSPNDFETGQRHLWRQIAIELKPYIGNTLAKPERAFEFLVWLKDQNAFHAEVRSIYRFYEEHEIQIVGITEGDGIEGYSVKDLRKIVIDEWHAAIKKFSDGELTYYKIAQLKYQMDTAGINATHRAIVLDNLDHLSPELQRASVDELIRIAELLEVRLIVAVRPLTWANQHGHQMLEIEEHKAPSVGDVIVSRLEYIAKHDTDDPGVSKAIVGLIKEIREPRSHLRRLLYATSGLGVRAALRNFRNFLLSPLLDSQLKFASQFSDLYHSTIARAFLMGSDNVIDQDNIEDLYSVQHVRDARRALLKPRILDFVFRCMGGRCKVIQLVSFCRDFEYPDDEIEAAINELMSRKRSLIWCNAFHKITDLNSAPGYADLAIAPMGASYYRRLFGEYLYTEACLAPNRQDAVPATRVIGFSKDLIVEDERQIGVYIRKKSSTDYYLSYGLDAPSISYLYWRNLEVGIKGRVGDWADYDAAWENRIRDSVQKLSRKPYLSGSTTKN